MSSSKPQSQQTPPGPPYAPTTWQLGGMPKKSVDIPIMSVFLVLYIASAAAHMTIFQLNKKHGKKFLMSALLFGFSMSRIVTSILRIASVSLPHDVPLAIAAAIFTQAGVVIIFVINLVFTLRIMRASHPHFAWHTLFYRTYQALIALVILVILMVISVVVQSFYTLNANTRRIDRDIQLAGVTYFAVVAFLPIPTVILGLLLPRRSRLDKFGEGRWRTKIRILLLAATLVCFGATYRAATSWKTPVPLSQPMPAYMHKAAFYIADFSVEVVVLFLYAILRVDRRFHIPNGASGHGSYSGFDPAGKNIDESRATSTVPTVGAATAESPSAFRIYSEEETFDEDEWLENKQRADLEKGDAESAASDPARPEQAH